VRKFGVNSRDEEGNNALHYAATGRHKQARPHYDPSTESQLVSHNQFQSQIWSRNITKSGVKEARIVHRVVGMPRRATTRCITPPPAATSRHHRPTTLPLKVNLQHEINLTA